MLCAALRYALATAARHVGLDSRMSAPIIQLCRGRVSYSATCLTKEHRSGGMVLHTTPLVVFVTFLTLMFTSAFAGLDGINWHADKEYISAHGRLELTRKSRLCTFID